MPKVEIARLVLDESLYPRHSVNSANMAQITEAILAGETMPPVLVSRSDYKVIDGWHRIHAFERLYGPEYEIDATLKTYKDKGAMLVDAIRANVGRGQDLTRWDHMRCVILAEEAGMPINTLAKLLKWRPEKLTEYQGSRTGTTLEGRRVQLKRSLRHRVGRPLTKSQEEANKHLSGQPALFHINQIITFLETDLMPEEEHVAARLNHMCQLVQAWLVEKGAYDGSQ